MKALTEAQEIRKNALLDAARACCFHCANGIYKLEFSDDLFFHVRDNGLRDRCDAWPVHVLIADMQSQGQEDWLDVFIRHGKPYKHVSTFTVAPSYSKKGLLRALAIAHLRFDGAAHKRALEQGDEKTAESLMFTILDKVDILRATCVLPPAKEQAQGEGGVK